MKSVAHVALGRDINAHIVHCWRRPYRARPSGQAVIKALAELKKADGDLPLLGAHILLAVARLRHGVVARALHTTDIDADRLARKASAEIQRRSNTA